jgi:hypothetical protein
LLSFLTLPVDTLFEMLDKSLEPELARDYQLTGLAKIEDNRYVLRLGRKIRLGLDEMESSR